MFSSIAQLRANNMEINIAKHAQLTDAWCQACIDTADDWVQQVLGNMYGVIPDTSPFSCEEAFNLLAQNAACEDALTRMYSQFRIGSSPDIEYWKSKKETQLELLLSGHAYNVNPPSFTGNKMDNRLDPKFGYGKYGERVVRTDLPTTTTVYEDTEDDV